MFNLLSLKYCEMAALVLGLLTIQLLSYIFWGLYVTADDLYQQFVNISMIQQAINFYWVSILVSAIWFVVCLYCRHAGNTVQHLLMVGGLSIFMSVLLYAAWVSGLFSLAVGAVLACAPFVGMILFPIRVVLISTMIAWAVFIGMTTATILGYLPYAPIFKANILHYSIEYSGFYFLSQIYFILPFLCMTVAGSSVYIRQSKERDAKILHLSRTDHLTQIYNRRTAQDVLTQLLSEQDAPPHPVSVVLIDLDFFKLINDQHGHLVGDRVLVVVAATLSESIRANDLVARFGGEEFLLVLHQTDRYLAAEVAERCRQQIVDCVVFSDDDQKVSLSASFGVACAMPSTAPNVVDQILRQADQALYQAKANGRNQVVLYQDLDIGQFKSTDGLKEQTN